jgi:hypothetical protein
MAWNFLVFFLILSFNIKFIGNRYSEFCFNLHSIRLFQSYDMSYEFGKLIQVD